MVRPKKMESSEVFGIRLPKSFIDGLPEDKSEKTEMIRQRVLDGKETTSGTSARQKSAISAFVELFKQLTESGKLDEYIDDSLIADAEILEVMSK
jgi:hypothetical protein